MRASLAWVIGITLLIALAWGLEQVAYAPLQTGDSYPPFSSMRSDPLGAKALYESLAALPGLTVNRLYKERPTMEDPHEALLVMGLDPFAWSQLKDKQLEEYEKLVKDGGRLIIAFTPVRANDGYREQFPPVQVRWHLEFAYRSHADDAEFPSGIPHETALFFHVDAPDPKQEWKTLAGSKREPSAIERTFGQGAIVLVADTYPLSNQGLRDARDAAYIANIIGPATHITFDENHFGVAETGSIAKLMRRYRLQGAIGMLLAVAALFLWRNTSSLLPPRTVVADAAVEGRDSLEGLAALLHRGVAQKQLLDTCFNEWRNRRSANRRHERTRSKQRSHAPERPHPSTPIAPRAEFLRSDPLFKHVGQVFDLRPISNRPVGLQTEIARRIQSCPTKRRNP